MFEAVVQQGQSISVISWRSDRMAKSKECFQGSWSKNVWGHAYLCSLEAQRLYLTNYYRSFHLTLHRLNLTMSVQVYLPIGRTVFFCPSQIVFMKVVQQLLSLFIILIKQVTHKFRLGRRYLWDDPHRVWATVLHSVAILYSDNCMEIALQRLAYERLSQLTDIKHADKMIRYDTVD